MICVLIRVVRLRLRFWPSTIIVLIRLCGGRRFAEIGWSLFVFGEAGSDHGFNGWDLTLELLSWLGRVVLDGDRVCCLIIFCRTYRVGIDCLVAVIPTKEIVDGSAHLQRLFWDCFGPDKRR